MKKRIEILLVISVLTLSIFGLIMIYSASYIWADYKFNDPYKFVKNQGLFFIIGTILMIIISIRKEHYARVNSRRRRNKN